MLVDDLKKAFREKYNTDPEFVVRCPGRVNLIGEHIDYSHYSVLPMAIQASTFILAAKSEKNQIHFFNLDKKFKEYTHEITKEMWPGTTHPEWYEYFLAGWRGVLERLSIDIASSKGMNLLVYGTIPPASGVSSSSALVCAAALTTIAMQTGKSFEVVSRSELAEMTAKTEKYVGTEGGGMDQAIECLAEKGIALRIDFHPLKWTPVTLPPNALFAVLHCGVTMNKGATSYYNQRVVECRIAAQIMAKKNGVKNWKEVRTLRDLARLLGNLTPDQMVIEVEKRLEKPADQFYDRKEILQALETNEQDFIQYSLNDKTRDAQEFWIKKRALHVYSEAARVFHFEEACRQGNTVELGKLMKESHTSCRDLFECSCPELDETVEKCLKAGCLGARLTGAGWAERAAVLE
uniref:Galactokinase n=1 Tax=Acrobeloides nanus TaxID=290746 RepID=A0A914DLH9_9BILA